MTRFCNAGPIQLSAVRWTTKLPLQNAAPLAAEFCEPLPSAPPERELFPKEKIAGNAQVDFLPQVNFTRFRIVRFCNAAPLKLSATRRTTKLPPQNAAPLAAAFYEPRPSAPTKARAFSEGKNRGKRASGLVSPKKILRVSVNARVGFYAKRKLHAFPYSPLL